MASLGSGMLFDSVLVNQFVNSAAPYTVPAGKVLVGQVGGTYSASTDSIEVGGARVGNTYGGPGSVFSAQFVAGPGTIIQTSLGGATFISGVFYRNP